MATVAGYVRSSLLPQCRKASSGGAQWFQQAEATRAQLKAAGVTPF